PPPRALFPYTTLFRSKENVIIGKLIPARASIIVERPTPIAEISMPESLLLPFIFDFERPEPLLPGDEESLFELLQSSPGALAGRSEEHTSELQSRENL